MSESERLAALEEQLSWLRHDVEELDATVQSEAAARERIAQQVARLERRLARLEAGNADDDRSDTDAV
jgi:uncharacterized coiled-coil protein SlyX